MPDCAAARLEVSAENAEATIELLRKHELMTANQLEFEVYEGHIQVDEDGLAIDLYDAPWGVDVFDEVIAELRTKEIAFTVTDGGHYTWDPYVLGWRPGMDNLGFREADLEGGPVLPEYKYNQAKELLKRDEFMIGQWLEGYFGDDPALWALPHGGKLPTASTDRKEREMDATSIRQAILGGTLDDSLKEIQEALRSRRVQIGQERFRALRVGDIVTFSEDVGHGLAGRPATVTETRRTRVSVKTEDGRTWTANPTILELA